MAILKKLIKIIITSLFLTYQPLYYDMAKGEENKFIDCNFNIPTSLQMHAYILIYSKKYGVPQNIAFGVANNETGYMGKEHKNYNPSLSSKGYAYGAMQIQVPTANYFTDKKVSKYDLLNNLELNVMLSMKILSYLKDKHKSWEKALGAYNTGKPRINNYAKRIVKFNQNKNFKYE